MNDIDMPERFTELPVNQQKELVKWISENLKSRQTFNSSYTSFGLKDIFEKCHPACFVKNGEFKGAMLKAGFKVKDKTATNWVFNVSKKSPAIEKFYST